jgi:uncharacterized protein (TIGR02246 family)
MLSSWLSLDIKDGRKRMKTILSYAVAAMVLISIPLSASTEDSMNRTAIDEANARLVELQKNGDAAGMGRMYTEDAILLPDGDAKREGREDIEAFWANALGGGVEDVRLTTENLVPLDDDLVYEIGSYTTTPRDSAPISGHYLVLWKRVDGAWKLHVDVFNGDGKPQ